MANKIVIVEDDRAVQLMYKLKLEHEGFQVAVASNGQEGLTLAEEFMPGLILLDLRMPIMNGTEMLTRLRETEWGSDMRVIILANTSKARSPTSAPVLTCRQIY